MDYLNAPFSFQVRKLARYTRLFGLRATAAKVEAELHVNGRPTIRRRRSDRGHVGIIGCGKFAYATVARHLARDQGDVLRGAMDTEIGRARSLGRRYGAAYATDQAERLLDDPEIDLIYVASNHASHAEYAIAALERGKCVHVEKPHVVSNDQLERLLASMQRSTGRIALGFNRPLSPLGLRALEALHAESGSSMLSWFVAGHRLPSDHWYYSEAEGGRAIGNLCHWTDFVYRAIPAAARQAVTVSATAGDHAADDFIVSFACADDSLATIAFSAKQHSFEGVRERLSAHRGELLLALDDFHSLRIERGAQRLRIKGRGRDHGHRESIARSYRMSGGAGGADVEYVKGTAELFLAAREAIETGSDQQLPLTGFDPSAARGSTGTVGSQSEWS